MYDFSLVWEKTKQNYPIMDMHINKGTNHSWYDKSIDTFISRGEESF